MAMPAIEKVWQHSVGTAYGGSGTLLTDHRQVLRGIKDKLIAFGLFPWTVSGSCDSLAFGMAGVDLWAADGDLVWEASGVAHSWIVLRQTGIKVNHELCIDCIGDASGYQLEVWESPSAGFAGGALTDRPTATDEIQLRSITNWIGTNGSSASFTARVQAMGSTDGECTRVIVHVNNLPVTIWIFDKLKGPSAGWSYPSVSLVPDAKVPPAALDTFGGLWATLPGTTSQARSYSGAYGFPVFFGGEGHGGKCSAERLVLVNDYDANWLALNVRAIGDAAGGRGVIGTFYDLWWGSAGLPEGACYPAAATKLYAQFADLVFPWDGSAPVIS